MGAYVTAHPPLASSLPYGFGSPVTGSPAGEMKWSNRASRAGNRIACRYALPAALPVGGGNNDAPMLFQGIAQGRANGQPDSSLVANIVNGHTVELSKGVHQSDSFASGSTFREGTNSGGEMPETLIDNVSDTALWVASYRAQESAREDALFRDHLADRLAGTKGLQIANRVQSRTYTAWAVVIRTCIVDAYIYSLITNGVDTVLNLGAGLDTRPYRLEVPASLHWIEVDYPAIVELKNNRLRNESPRCRLDRVALDLSDRTKRAEFLARISAGSSKALVITEGVLLYLKTAEVASLADDLRKYDSFRFWIVDFYAGAMIRLLRVGVHFRPELKNSPIQFFPHDWFDFFQQYGWEAREKRLYAEESRRLGRAIPVSSLVRVLRPLLPSKWKDGLGSLVGYALLERNVRET